MNGGGKKAYVREKREASVSQRKRNPCQKRGDRMKMNSVNCRFQTVVVLAVIGVFLLSAAAAAGQTKDRLVLIVESKIRLNPETPGQAGWETEAKGEAYLQAQSNGRFSGIGDMSVTYRFLVSPNPYFKYSTMKGQGTFVVKGVKEGKNLRFWFEQGNIPVKGTLTVSMPHISKTEPYETTFDPHNLAPGDPLPGNGVMIELRDGAAAAIDVPGAGKTTFSLYGVEIWRVSVVGEETDSLRPNIQNPKLTNESKELSVAVQFRWNLTGEFTVTGRSGSRRYLNGHIFSATVNPVLQFEHWDLYNCESIECVDERNPDDLEGKPIDGTVTGNSVRLRWPEFFSVECIRCIPIKTYLGRAAYRQEFSAKEFMDVISREELPLVDGNVVKGGILDWMRYTIILRKID